MRTAACVILLLTLAACGNGVGEPGSMMWKLTANDMERRNFGDADRTQARLECAQGGYTGAGYEACVENSMKY